MLCQIKERDSPAVFVQCKTFLLFRQLESYRLVSFFIFAAFIFSCKVGEEDAFVIYLAFTRVSKCGLPLFTDIAKNRT